MSAAQVNVGNALEWKAEEIALRIERRSVGIAKKVMKIDQEIGVGLGGDPAYPLGLAQR